MLGKKTYTILTAVSANNDFYIRCLGDGIRNGLINLFGKLRNMTVSIQNIYIIKVIKKSEVRCTKIYYFHEFYI